MKQTCLKRTVIPNAISFRLTLIAKLLLLLEDCQVC